MKLSYLERLCYITTRIETIKTNGENKVATGFFVRMNIEGKDIIYLVTNRHVAENTKTITIHINRADNEGNPILGECINIEIENAQKVCILHPNPMVDLALFKTEEVLKEAQKICPQIALQVLTESSFMKSNQKELDAVEDIIMVGYPKGLWDKTNNRPLFRKGITATDPKTNYNGQKRFLIDCGCIYGSSGSPVLIYNKGIHADKFGNRVTLGESSLTLLGIFSELHTHIEHVVFENIDGKSITKEINIPINIGYVEKVENLLDFKVILRQQII